jgi:hypothetical protein
MRRRSSRRMRRMRKMRRRRHRRRIRRCVGGGAPSERGAEGLEATHVAIAGALDYPGRKSPKRAIKHPAHHIQKCHRETVYCGER